MTDSVALVKQFDNMRAFMMKVMEENRQLKHRCEVFEASEKRFTETITKQSEAYEETIREAEFTIEELETKLSDKDKYEETIRVLQTKIASQHQEFHFAIVDKDKKIAELEKKVNRKAYEKKYKEQNKDKIKKQNKEYKEKNKEVIKSKGAEIVNCPCGKTHRYDNTRRHKMSAFHQKWLAGQSETQTSA